MTLLGSASAYTEDFGFVSFDTSFRSLPMLICTRRPLASDVLSYLGFLTLILKIFDSIFGFQGTIAVPRTGL